MDLIFLRYYSACDKIRVAVMNNHKMNLTDRSAWSTLVQQCTLNTVYTLQYGIE